jgi:hypothetical protein
MGSAAEDRQNLHTVPLPPPAPKARREIIFSGARDPQPQRLSHDLILAIARARRWMRDLLDGTYADTAEIAQRNDMNEAYVRRLLRLNYLAPDIVEAIVEGRQPRILTVKRLLQGVPILWDEQRAVFGIRS